MQISFTTCRVQAPPVAARLAQFQGIRGPKPRQVLVSGWSGGTDLAATICQMSWDMVMVRQRKNCWYVHRSSRAKLCLTKLDRTSLRVVERALAADQSCHLFLLSIRGWSMSSATGMKSTYMEVLSIAENLQRLA